MHRLKLPLIGILFATSLWASPVWDKEYAFKNFVVAVINNVAEPIHGDQVEGVVIAHLRNNFRYDFSDAGYLYLKEALKRIPPGTLKEISPEKLEFIRPTLKELSNQGVGAAILVELEKKESSYDVHFVLATTARGEIIQSTVETIEAPTSLEGFSQSAKSALALLLKSIPFDASVIRRDGYLVILDQGQNYFQPGAQLPTYTIEMKEGQIVFEETGMILLTRVEENVSFGKILVERKPLEVLQGNKIRVLDRVVAQVPLASLPAEDQPDIISQTSMTFTEFEVEKGSVGKVELDLGANLIQYGNVGAQTFNSNIVYPMGRVHGELWFTSRVFLDLAMTTGMGSFANVPNMAGNSTGTSIGSFGLQVGYRMNITAPDPGPVVSVKLGFGSNSYEFAGAAEPLLFTGVRYAGLKLSGGIRIPAAKKWGFGAELNTLIFPSVKEDPVTSGANAAAISSWDLVLRGYYDLAKDMDLEARAVFINNSADFSGTATRTTRVTQATQSGKALLLGISYFF